MIGFGWRPTRIWPANSGLAPYTPRCSHKRAALQGLGCRCGGRKAALREKEPDPPRRGVTAATRRDQTRRSKGPPPGTPEAQSDLQTGRRLPPKPVLQVRPAAGRSFRLGQQLGPSGSARLVQSHCIDARLKSSLLSVGDPSAPRQGLVCLWTGIRSVADGDSRMCSPWSSMPAGGSGGRPAERAPTTGADPGPASRCMTSWPDDRLPARGTSTV